MRLRRIRRFQNGATIALFVLGPLLAVLTFAVVGPLNQSGGAGGLRAVLLADLVYVLVLAGLVAQRVVKMIGA
ncbi:hypothetical protein, partial [Pacificibacter sp.]|uniref:hypothetical protein n=1 Tax=Pacificibacter sp. TaxID=1917866 RepID=UPI00321B21FE